MVAAKAGSDAAFAELVERYQQRLLRFLLTRCSSRADAEDALQDTLVNAYRYLHSYDERWRFSTWIYRIGLRNLARSTSLAGPEALSEELPDHDADPLRDCIAQSERENLWLTAKRVLSEDARTALWLRYIEDMSIRDIATVMERSVSWTKVSLLRSRGRLGVALADDPAAGKKGEAYG